MYLTTVKTQQDKWINSICHILLVTFFTLDHDTVNKTRHGGVGIDLASRDRSGGSADYPDRLTRFSFGIGVFKLHII